MFTLATITIPAHHALAGIAPETLLGGVYTASTIAISRVLHDIHANYKSVLLDIA